MRIGLWDALRFPGTYHTGAYGRLPAFPRSTPPSNQPGGWVFPYGHTHSRGSEIPPPPPPSPPLHQASEGKERNWGRRGIKGAPIRGGRGRGSPGTRSPPSHPKKRGRGGAPPPPFERLGTLPYKSPLRPCPPSAQGPSPPPGRCTGMGRGAAPGAPSGERGGTVQWLKSGHLALDLCRSPGDPWKPGNASGWKEGGGRVLDPLLLQKVFQASNQSVDPSAGPSLPSHGACCDPGHPRFHGGTPPPRTPEGLRTCPSVGEGEGGGLVGLTGDPSPSFPDIRWGGRGPGAKGTGRGTTTRGWPFTIPFRCG